MWQQGVSDVSGMPVSRSKWNSRVKLLVNAYGAHKTSRAFELADADHQVKVIANYYYFLLCMHFPA